ncbi:MAG TPA: SpoIIE family protein phosphatase, partial [Thermoanaerobaculia bacterium]|nr:SpoIIE family protein phosphatase [Thermoanaerobaculia bacterium]
LPLGRADDGLGLVLLEGGDEGGGRESEVLLLRAAATYLSVLLANQQMSTEMREGEFQLKYRLWELESLYDIGLSIASTLNLDDLTDEILVRTLSLLNARRAALYLRQGDRFVLHQSIGDVRSQFFDEELELALTNQLVHEGEPILFDSGADCIFPGCSTMIALPIKSEREVVGILAAADRELRDGGVGPFEENDIRLLSRFANQAAIALENARLHREALEKQAMERELELAATIQGDILPHSIPSVEGLEIAAWTRPARQLGGDYYSLFPRDGGLSFCVADVSGKSTPAAILVSAFHAALQLLFEEDRDLANIVTELNRHIHRWSSQSKFITLFLATVDRERSLIRYVNAGHNPAYLVDEGTIEPLKSHGLPIGMMSESRYSAMTRPFAPGSLVLAYSDGITEAENGAEEEFGNDRLVEVIQNHRSGSCAALGRALIAAVDAFTEGQPQGDDQTLTIVRSGF